MSRPFFSIHNKITALTFFIIIFSLFVTGLFIIGTIMNKDEKKIGEQSMLVARTVAQSPEIQQLLQSNQPLEEQAAAINRFVEDVRMINQADYIVVYNMQRQRMSHPVESRLLTKSIDTLGDAAYTEHYYTEKVQGTIGKAMRAYVPIMKDAKQVGIVVVGYKLPTFGDFLKNIQAEVIMAAFISLLIGLWGAFILSRNIKKELLNYEPHEIANLYIERTETFNAMHEGVIAIDQNYDISIFNDQARKILGIDLQVNPIGKNIYDILPDTRLPEILHQNKAIYNKELQINHHSILSNRVPITVKGQTVGAIAIFQDRTEMKKLAEELTGVQEFVQALRIQNHEHKNKMHTVAGLLQLKYYEEALQYIVDVKAEQEELADFLNKRIQNQNIAGLLLSKINHGKELGIDVIIDEHSQLTELPAALDFQDFVVIIGNLVENAFDALQLSNNEQKEVLISIDQDEQMLSILVEDNGIGISEEQLSKIFHNGYSTKNSKNHGIGLYLIYDIVTKADGQIDVTSEVNEGTTICITFEMDRGI